METSIWLAIVAVVFLVGNWLWRSRAGGIRAAGGSGEPPFWMRVTVTLVFAAASLYIILSPDFPEPEKKWAFGVAGTVLGYWLG